MAQIRRWRGRITIQRRDDHLVGSKMSGANPVVQLTAVMALGEWVHCALASPGIRLSRVHDLACDFNSSTECPGLHNSCEGSSFGSNSLADESHREDKHDSA